MSDYNYNRTAAADDEAHGEQPDEGAEVVIKLNFQTKEKLNSVEKQLLGDACLKSLQIAKPKLRGRLEAVMQKVTQGATSQGSAFDL